MVRLTHHATTVLYTGLHLGTKTDDVIWEDTMPDYPMEDWEYWIGDAAYEYCCGCVVRHVQPPGGVLWPHEVFFNQCLNHWRQRVEHTMHLIKDHGMWRALKCRNCIYVLDASMKLTVHLTNISIKLNAPFDTVLDGAGGPRCRYPGHAHGPHY